MPPSCDSLLNLLFSPKVFYRLGTGAMPYYRLYHLDPFTGHIRTAEELFAADDVGAMYEVQQRRSDHPLELWERGRKVGRTDPAPEAAAYSRAVTG